MKNKFKRNWAEMGVGKILKLWLKKGNKIYHLIQIIYCVFFRGKKNIYHRKLNLLIMGCLKMRGIFILDYSQIWLEAT
jgi:hypothetical protein